VNADAVFFTMTHRPGYRVAGTCCVTRGHRCAAPQRCNPEGTRHRAMFSDCARRSRAAYERHL